MILALKTAGPVTNFWLYPVDHAQPATAQQEWESGRQLADQLLAKLVEFLGHRPVPEQTLTGIIIFGGPGSFTSLRIGHTVVNALADSLNIPVLACTGDDWLTAGRLAIGETPVGRPVMPFYGAEPNITKPKS